jgi:two-component system response regulator YesN
MLNVMVVDDDYLVRQGIIRVLPWETFGMRVVSEAANGLEALEKLPEQPIDLLVTDLAMPVMSGLDLIRKVRQDYPHIHIVVLTFHHEFELVRDALRLGVIDYITKVELEDDRIAQILQRVAERIGRAPRETAAETERERNAWLTDDAVDTLFCVRGDRKSWVLLDAFRADGDAGGDVIAPQPDGAHPLDGIRVRWRGVRGMARDVLLQKLELYGEHVLFYCADRETRHCELPADRLAETRSVPRDELVKLGLEWSSMAWLADDAHFDRLLERTKSLSLPAAHLEQMMYMAVEPWSGMPEWPKLRPDDGRRPLLWEDWVERLKDYRRSVLGHASRRAYSPEIVASVLRAADMVRQNMRQELPLTEVANAVNMSRSYFSRCFRDIIGKTYQDYVRDVRIEHAKQLLRHTQRSISWIAAESGYPNERYFSRVFRRMTGLLPRDYRRRHRNGQQSHLWSPNT